MSQSTDAARKLITGAEVRALTNAIRHMLGLDDLPLSGTPAVRTTIKRKQTRKRNPRQWRGVMSRNPERSPLCRKG